MLFDSVVFLFAFLPVLLIVYHLMPGQLKNGALLLASLIFYAWGGLVCVIFLICSILFNYICGLWIAGILKKRRAAKRRMIICLVINVGMLLILKFDSHLFAGMDVELPVPVGITVYTLQMLSYIIEVYRGNVKVQRNPVDLALYAVMFPKLPAGPVVKYSAFEKQLRERKSSWVKFGDGAMFFIRGLAKKVLFADNIGIVHTEIMALKASQMSALSAWLGCVSYAFQIYFACSGYSDMAIGLGRMAGFELPKNFDYPYAARSVSEFWRRWHVTLGAWVKEYMHLPLGTERAPGILIIWILAGLWHGPSWNFVTWGLYFAILIVAEKYLLQGFSDYIPGFLSRILSLIFIFAGWVFFFSPDFGEAVSYLKVMFGIGANGLIDNYGRFILVSNLELMILLILGLTPGVYRGCEKIFDRGGKGRAVLSGILYGVLFLLCAAYAVTGVHQPFLYLRF